MDLQLAGWLKKTNYYQEKNIFNDPFFLQWNVTPYMFFYVPNLTLKFAFKKKNLVKEVIMKLD